MKKSANESKPLSLFTLLFLPLSRNHPGNCDANVDVIFPLEPPECVGSHVVAESCLRYIPVCIKGAKKLIITFAPETRCESGCDYMRIYKDSSKSEHWGEDQYHGGKDGGTNNWPSLQGRPPLVIPADNFLIFWHTDGSVNDWGWKMTVTPDMGSARGLVPGGRLGQEMYLAEIQMLMSEMPAPQAVPTNLGSFKKLDRKKPSDANVDPIMATDAELERLREKLPKTSTKGNGQSRRFIVKAGTCVADAEEIKYSPPVFCDQHKCCRIE